MDDQRGAGSYQDRKSTRLNSSHSQISYAVFCLKKKKKSNSKISLQMKLIGFLSIIASPNIIQVSHCASPRVIHLTALQTCLFSRSAHDTKDVLYAVSLHMF